MAGLVFHVVNRGSRRGPIFEVDAQFEAFEQILHEALQRVPLPLIEYCTMRNHFHLIVQPRSDLQLPTFMHWFTSTQAARWRKATNTVGEGAVYQGRYKAIPVETEEYFYTLAAYVQRNPVRAHAVTRAEEWRWGSLWHREHAAGRIPLAEWPLPRPANWLAIVNAPQPATDVHEIRRSVNTGYPLGNDRFQQELAKHMGIREIRRGPGRPRQR